jgi:DNA-3-methyladenine glycosylase I
MVPSTSTRCAWAKNDLAIAYHDREWGVPQHDDRILFEFLILEGAQAGLSWDTILRKRENYRAALDNFNPSKIARYDKRKLESLMKNEGLVRNRLKMESLVKNAKAFLDVQSEFGSFDRYIWQFIGGSAESEYPAQNRGGSRAHSGIRCHEQGPAKARIHLRGINHLLRLHAGGRHGQRSLGRLLQIQAGVSYSEVCTVIVSSTQICVGFPESDRVATARNPELLLSMSYVYGGREPCMVM